MVQVKGVMPPRGGISRETPPTEPLGHLEYDITFNTKFGIIMSYLQKQPETKEM